MAGSGPSIGSVSIKVTPDTTAFKPSLQKYLDRLEKSTRLSIKVDADTSQLSDEVRAALARISAESVKAAVGADTTEATKNVDAWKARLKAAGGVSIKVSADTSGLKQLGTASKLFKDVYSSGALLSGLKFTGIAAGLAQATTGAAQLLVSLQAVAPAAALIPAALGAAAAAGATLKVGLSGVGDAVKSAFDPSKVKDFDAAMKKLAPSAQAFVKELQGLAPGFRSLKLDVQNRLFLGLSDSLAKLGTTYLPVLQKGMNGVADSTNVAAKGFVDMLTSANQVKGIATIFANTQKSVGPLGAALGSVVNAFTSIAAVGSSFLPQLSAGAAKAAASFNTFVQASAKSGALKNAIQGALDALKQLGQIVVNVGSILGSVFKAANSQGTSLFAVIAQVTGQFAAFLKSAGGIAFLQGLFSGLKAVIQGVMSVLGPLITAIGTQLGPVLGSLGSAIGTGFQALIPAIQPVVTALAALGPVIGSIAQLLGTVLSGALQLIAPIITALAPLVTNLAQALGPILGGFLAQVTPIISQLANIFISALGPALNAILPLISTLGQYFAAYWGGVLVPVLKALMPIISSVVEVLAGAFMQVLQALIPIFPVLGQALGAIAQALGTALLGAVSALAPLLPQLAGAFASLVVPLIQGLLPVIQALSPLLPIIAGVLVQVLQAVLPLIPTIAGLVAAFLPLITTLANILIPVIQALLPIIVTVFNAIVPIIQDALQIITGVIEIFTGLLTGNWSKVWKGIKDVVGGALKAVRDIIVGALDIIGSTVWGALKAIGQFFANTFGGLVKSVGGAIGDVVGFFGRLGGRIFSAIGNLINDMATFGINLVRGIVTGMGRVASDIGNFLLRIAKDALNGILKFFGIASPSKLMRDKVGVQIAAGIAVGIDRGAPKVQSSMDSLSDMVTGAAFNAQTSIKAAVSGNGTLFAGITGAVREGFAGVGISMDGRAVGTGIKRATKIDSRR